MSISISLRLNIVKQLNWRFIEVCYFDIESGSTIGVSRLLEYAVCIGPYYFLSIAADLFVHVKDRTNRQENIQRDMDKRVRRGVA